MKRSTWLVVGAIACVSAQVTRVGKTQDPGLDSRPQPEAGPLVDSSFERRIESIDRAMEKIVDLRADFEQRKHTPLLKKPMISKGSLLMKGSAIRWDTEVPRQSTMVVEAARIRMYYPDDRLVEVYEGDGNIKDLGGAPLPRLLSLRERFELSAASPKDMGVEGDDPHLLAILLTPKGEELRRHVQSVRVLIDETGPVATRVVVVDADGEKTEISFSHVRINTGVELSEVELHLPDGVRISRPLGE